MAALRDAMAGWLEAAIAAGDPIPDPSSIPVGRFTGRMLLRMPGWLHRELAEQATREDVSVNQLAVMLLAAGVERERARFLAEVEKALDTTGVAPGPEREIRQMLRLMIRDLAQGGHWDPASDPPGSAGPALGSALLRFFASLPDDAADKIQEMLRHAAALKSNVAGVAPAETTG